MPGIGPEPLTFEYRLRYRGAPGMEHDPSDYAMRWDVTAYRHETTDDGAERNEVVVGRAAVHVVPKAGMINLRLATDANGGELAKASEILSVSRPDLVTKYLQYGGDLMVVSSLSVLPEFRGERIGYRILQAIIATVGRSVDLVVVHAAPPGGDTTPEEGTPEYRAATESLRSYWRGFGFEEAAGDHLVLVTKKIQERVT